MLGVGWSVGEIGSVCARERQREREREKGQVGGCVHSCGRVCERQIDQLLRNSSIRLFSALQFNVPNKDIKGLSYR